MSKRRVNSHKSKRGSVMYSFLIVSLNLMLVVIFTSVIVMIGLRLGDTVYTTAWSWVALLPSVCIGSLTGIVWKFNTKKSVHELWDDIVKNYGNIVWTAILITVTLLSLVILFIVSRPETWMKRSPADVKNHEVLILFAKFHQISGNPLQPNEEWQFTCQDAKERLSKAFNISCQTIPQEITSVREAHDISDLYQASLVVWGNVRGAVVEAHYTDDTRWGASTKNLTHYQITTRFSGSQDELTLFVSRDGGDMDFVLDLVADAICRASKDWSCALSYSTQALDILPKGRASDLGEFELLLDKFTSSLFLGEYDVALSTVNLAIKLYPDRYEGYHALSSLEILGFNDWDAGFNDINISISLNPDVARLYYERSFMFLNRNDYGSALLDMSHAVDLDPSNSEFYYNRGVLYGDMFRYKQAIDDVNHAISIGPEARFYETLAWLHQKSGQNGAGFNDHSTAVKMATVDSLTATPYPGCDYLDKDCS